MYRKIVYAIVALVLFAYLAASTPSSAQGIASANLAETNSAIGGAFVAVYKAEVQNYANVAVLVSQLNNSTQLVNGAIAISPSNPSQAARELLVARSMAQQVSNQTGAAGLAGSTAHQILIYNSVAESAGVIILAASLYLLLVFVYDRWWLHTYAGYRVFLRKQDLGISEEELSASSARTPNPTLTRSAKRKVAAGSLVLIALFITFALLQPFFSPFPNNQKDTQFAILGPNLTASGYPTKVAVNQPFHLYGYLADQEGAPQYYHLMIKEAGTGVHLSSTTPANAPVISEYYFVLDNNQTRTFPMSLTANSAGTQTLIFELWAYVPSNSGWSFSYTGVYNQIWLNVTDTKIR